MNGESTANNPAVKTQVQSQTDHLKDDLSKLKSRLARVKQIGSGYVHEAEEGKIAANAAINAIALHIEAAEEKLTEFLHHIV